MIVGLIEIVRSCEMEMNVGKTKVKRIPIQPFLLYIKLNNKGCNVLYVKLNPGLPLKKQHSTRRLFSTANWSFKISKLLHL